MPSTRDIKRRQKSVSNTRQVTKAMEMVAASKMRKSQAVALESRPYAQKAIEILAHIKSGAPDMRSIYLDGAGGEKTLALVVTSDKGLCGGLNSAVIKECASALPQNTDVLLVGAKSKAHFEKTGRGILEVFKGAGDYVELEQVKPLADFIRKKYKTGEYGKVLAIYTEFVSTLKQKVEQRQILPIAVTHPPHPLSYSKRGGGPADVLTRSPSLNVREGAGGESYGAQEYIFEPSPRAVLENLIPFLIDIYVYHIILESNASEHSARMVAMKNASDSAENILDELTLSYNKARQAAITNEITEITAGVEALK